MEGPISRRTELGYILIVSTLLLYSLLILPALPQGIGVDYYDNTSVTTYLNVTNVPPLIFDIEINDNDTYSGSPNIILTQGDIDLIWCNATVTDKNGYQDIIGFNASFFHTTSTSESVDDNNDHYTSTTCTNTTVNGTSLKVACSLSTWFYANNGTWTCNMSAMDQSTETGSGIGTKIIDPLYALDLNTSTIDYGALEPGEYSTGDEVVLITNFGNMDINISVEGYGQTLQDGYAMFCETGNISVYYEKYDVASGVAVPSMNNLTTTPLLTGIPGLTVVQNTNDAGNSTNETYWKMHVPIGEPLKGYCNGTVIFSAIGPV